MKQRGLLLTLCTYQARVAIRNMFLGDKNKQSDLLIPWCTYTEPEVAHVGKYEAELKEAGVEFESYMVRFFSSFHFLLWTMYI